MRARTITATVCGILCFSAASLAQDKAGWKPLEKKDGVAVSAKEIAGQGIPIYRGQTQIDAPILQVLSVLLDDARSKEWAKDVSEARVLRVVDDHRTIVYSRSHQTWPVKDRDLVMMRTVAVPAPGESYVVRLVCTPNERPEVSRVVRIKECDSTFELRKIEDNATEVDFRMRVEPGGSHPDWAVRMASKKVPLDTLVGLRKQAKVTAGAYTKEMKRYAALR